MTQWEKPNVLNELNEPEDVETPVDDNDNDNVCFFLILEISNIFSIFFFVYNDRMKTMIAMKLHQKAK